MSTSYCLISANDDFAGIGVRVAFYMQALLPLASFAFNPYPTISTSDVNLVKQYCEHGTGSLVVYSATSSALLVAAFVGRLRRQLSPYHALVALNLTWIFLISSCVRAAALFYLQKHGIPGSSVEMLHKSVMERLRDRIPLKQRQESAPVTVSGDSVLFRNFCRHVSVQFWHLLATGALGWLLFSDVEGFAGPAGCPRDTVLWMFSTFVHITDPTLRLFWKSIYMMTLLSLFSLPILCFLICFTFILTFALLHELGQTVSRRLPFCRGRPAVAVDSPSPSNTLPLRAFGALCVALLILLIVSTEKTVANNPVAQGSDVWGFGQTLALILGAFALYDAGVQLQMGLKLRAASRHGCDPAILP